MFKRNYKNAMDNITPSSDTKEQILDRIILKEENKKQKNPAVIWRIGFACVACVAIVLGIVFVPKSNIELNISDEAQTLKVAKSYDEIYKLIKPKKDYNFLNNFAVTDDAEYIVEESNGDFSDTGAMPGTTTNSANKGENTSSNLSDSNNGKTDDYSTTTEQVEGVAEADIVKTDGEYIYYVNDTTLSIVKAEGKNSTLISQTELSNTISKDLYGEMFLKEDRLILLKTGYYAAEKNDSLIDYNGLEEKVLIEIYDIANRTVPKKIAQTCQDGGYISSRMVGDYVYLISNCNINLSNIDKNDPTTFVPTTETNGVCEPVSAESIYRYEQESYTNRYTVIAAYGYSDGTLKDTVSLLGGTDNIYCSQGNIILANSNYSNKNYEGYSTNTTTISKLAIKEGRVEYKTSGNIDGVLDNQFFIDEYNDHFRFVTTVTQVSEKTYKFENSDNEVVSYSQDTFASLTVLDGDLKKVGEIKNIAQGERVYSVRFMGDIAYFVTFRQTDPLFSVDLSDPQNPKILGELKIPGFSEYMYPYGDGLLLGFGMDADENTGRTSDLKLSMFNITDPKNVIEQDKTIVNDCGYSPALSNHKAMLVNYEKNLIGFAATEDWRNEKYMIYEYTGEGFVCKAVLNVNDQYNYYAMTDVRGLFVDESFYVVSDKQVQVFDINDFNLLTTIAF